MAARPSWRGQIRLALVSIPVEIYPASKSGASVSFHQIHEPSGKRIKYEKVVPGVGPVSADDIVKGFEVTKGEYVLLEPEEIEKVKLESRKTLELTQFVDLSDIDPIYYDKPYFVVPADDLVEEAVKTAATIAAMAPLAVLANKEMVNAAFETGLGMGVQFERRLFHGLFGTADQSEGMAAFVEKRAGAWTGK